MCRGQLGRYDFSRLLLKCNRYDFTRLNTSHNTIIRFENGLDLRLPLLSGYGIISLGESLCQAQLNLSRSSAPALPAPYQRANCLPAPKDGFRFAARFYGAYTPLIDGSYNMPGVVRVD